MKAAMDKVDQQYLTELMQYQGEGGEARSVDVKVKDDGTTLPEIEVHVAHQENSKWKYWFYRDKWIWG